MEHVLMDDRGNTTKTYGKNRSVLAYVLFALMFIVGGVGIALFYNFVHGASGSQALPAATFTPFLSSSLAGFGGKCEIIPDAEDFITCKSGYENVDEDQILRCPSGYDNIRVTKVRLGENGQKSPRDMTLLRHACLGMDSCKFTLADLRAADDGSKLEPVPIPVEEEEIIIEPEEIIEDVAGVDSNGHVLMKHHEHPYHHYPGKVRVYYECDKIEENPFSFLESIFEDMIGEPEIIPDEEVATEETATEETPIILSKALGHKCKTKLKNVAQDWDAGHVCGTSSTELTLSCDPARSGTRIFVLNVTPKVQKRPAADPAAGADSGVDPVIEDTTSSVENEPFLAKHGHHNHGGKGNKKQGKHLGWQLTDICATQTGDCTTTLGTDLQLQEANPLIDDTTPIHVKYLCSYEH